MASNHAVARGAGIWCCRRSVRARKRAVRHREKSSITVR